MCLSLWNVSSPKAGALLYSQGPEQSLAQRRCIIKWVNELNQIIPLPQISRQRASVLHIEKAAFIPGQVTDAGHQANISLSSKINKPECPRNVCTCFSEAITKISQEKYLVL